MVFIIVTIIIIIIIMIVTILLLSNNDNITTIIAHYYSYIGYHYDRIIAIPLKITSYNMIGDKYCNITVI